MEHSKLLWKKKHYKILDFHDRLIADVRGACGFQEDEANAAFIVQACNAHYDLMGLLENVLKGVDIDLDSCQSLYNEIKGDK